MKTNSKRYIHPNVHAATFTTGMTQKQPKCPSTDSWPKEMCHSLTHTHRHTHIHRHTHTLTHSLTLSHTLSYIHTHTLSHTLTHTHTLSHTHSHTLSHMHTHTHTHTHTVEYYSVTKNEALPFVATWMDLENIA